MKIFEKNGERDTPNSKILKIRFLLLIGGVALREPPVIGKGKMTDINQEKNGEGCRKLNDFFPKCFLKLLCKFILKLLKIPAFFLRIFWNWTFLAYSTFLTLFV